VLIVCEGSKTEVNYFEEIRQQARLPMVDFHVVPSNVGTEPKQVIESAEIYFKRERAFERIYVVFDRDDHKTYVTAIEMAEAREKRPFKSHENQPVKFEAVVSVPCFELWLLLHYSDIREMIHRKEAYSRLKTHMPAYSKGTVGTFEATASQLEQATARATALKAGKNRKLGCEAYTDVHELVTFLRSIKAER
jgi:hypothetical protein